MNLATLLLEIATLTALSTAAPAATGPAPVTVDLVRPGRLVATASSAADAGQVAPPAAARAPAPKAPKHAARRAPKAKATTEATTKETTKAKAEAGRKTAAAPGADAAVALTRKVQRFYEKTRDFVAHFEQRYTYKVLGRTTKSAGTVSFKKPGLMRWDYDTPREKHFIVDGSTLWVYTPEDHTVIRRPNFRPGSLSSSITFLWGKGDLLAEFDVALAGEATLKLTPKTPQPGFASLRFVVDPKTGRVLESTVIDAQGNENHLVFSDAKLDTGLPKARFTFRPPKGATVQTLGPSGLR